MERTWTRRGLLGAGLAVGGAAALTACGGDPSVPAPSSPASSATPTPAASVAAVPRTAGPADGPGLLLVHAWWGVTPGVLAWADQLGAAGAHVLVPDLYGGQIAQTVEQAEALSDALDQDDVSAQLEDCASQLAARGAWSAVGFSLGAFQVCQLVTTTAPPDRVVLFYGGARVAGVTTTHAAQVHLVPDDPYFSEDEVDGTLSSLDRAGVEVQRFDYPRASHWFAEPGSPAYDEQAADQARQRALSFLGL